MLVEISHLSGERASHTRPQLPGELHIAVAITPGRTESWSECQPIWCVPDKQFL